MEQRICDLHQGEPGVMYPYDASVTVEQLALALERMIVGSAMPMGSDAKETWESSLASRGQVTIDRIKELGGAVKYQQLFRQRVWA